MVFRPEILHLGVGRIVRHDLLTDEFFATNLYYNTSGRLCLARDERDACPRLALDQTWDVNTNGPENCQTTRCREFRNGPGGPPRATPSRVACYRVWQRDPLLFRNSSFPRTACPRAVVGRESTPTVWQLLLDSRLRGNDGRRAGLLLDSRVRGNDARRAAGHRAGSVAG